MLATGTCLMDAGRLAGQIWSGNIVRQTLLAGASALGCSVGWLMLQDTTLRNVCFLGGVVASAVTTQKFLKWCHIPFHLIVQPKLYAMGVHYRIGETKERQFAEGECKGENSGKVAKLFYEYHNGEKFAVLDLQEIEDPYERGKCQGLLMAETIRKLYEAVLEPLITLARLRVGAVDDSRLRDKVNVYAFTKNQLDEMQGLCDGVAEHFANKGDAYKLLLETVKKAHCVADTYKFGGKSMFTTEAFQTALGMLLGDLGCSVAVRRTDEGMHIARNTDWPGFEMGPKAVIMRWKANDGSLIEALSYPGVVGTTVAIRMSPNYSNSLYLSVNERTEISRETGVPYTTLAKKLIQECSTVEEVIQKLREDNLPASSFNLTVADTTTACRIEFWPSKDTPYRIYRMGEDGCLFTTNHATNPDTGEPVDSAKQNPLLKLSIDRYQKMQHVVQNKEAGQSGYDISRSCLVETNTPFTMSSMVFHLQADKEPERYYACANTYSAYDLPKESPFSAETSDL